MKVKMEMGTGSKLLVLLMISVPKTRNLMPERNLRFVFKL